ncbi:MAG: 50S ribosomal protein L18 [Gemmatimonadetes bacterium]|jgi:large subunit ribosomal protein L18|nr:50S ribosomal protein L18 [Gemmatimonadota bacterium]
MRDRNHLIQKRVRRERRRYRLRKSVSGTPERPRLVVHRSLRNIEAQVIDDVAGHSLVGLSTLSQELKGEKFENRVAQGREIGKRLAAKAREQGIETVVFDRGGFLYHGIIKAVAEGAREGGLKF